MKENKLISMVDYVFLQIKIKFRKDGKSLENFRRFWSCENYAKFLSQPLKLEMFIPVDDEGNVLKKPNYSMSGYDHKYEQYQKALDKVLFDIEIKEIPVMYGHIKSIPHIGFWTLSGEWTWGDNKTIQDLIPYNLILKK